VLNFPQTYKTCIEKLLFGTLMFVLHTLVLKFTGILNLKIKIMFDYFLGIFICVNIVIIVY